MSTVDTSTNPQITHDDSTNPFESKQKNLDHVAEDMATKAGKVEHHSETSGNVGGVSPTSGGIFTK
jgi:hypothetical protein